MSLNSSKKNLLPLSDQSLKSINLGEIQHDLKNMINVVLGHLQLIDDPDEDIDTCLKTLRKMVEYVDDLNKYEKICNSPRSPLTNSPTKSIVSSALSIQKYPDSK
jgi:signal transduction histidine kinase